MQYYTAVMRFTFHYVSIKTNYFMRYGWHALSFTFHYVSINTRIIREETESVLLYIPLCFY